MTENMEFTELLKSEFDSRRKKNGRYSLRAYSKHLGISPSTLSRLFNGTLYPTHSILARIADKLSLTEEQLAHLKQDLQFQKKQRSIKNIEKEQSRNLSDLEFELMSDWFHTAILESLRIMNFQLNPKWIAQKFDISQEEAKRSLQVLEKLKLIKVEGDKAEVLSQQTTTLDQTQTSQAKIKYQLQSFEKSRKALTEVPIHLRDHSSIVMIADQKLLPEVKRRIKSFRRSLANFIELRSKRTANATYQLQISLFPLMSLTEDKETKN